MKKDKEERTGFSENTEIVLLDIPQPAKSKTGNCSKTFEAALNAVEEMGKKTEH